MCLDSQPSTSTKTFTKTNHKICLKVSVENYFLCDDQTDQKGGSLPLPGAAPAFPQPPERSGSKTGNSRQIRGGVNTEHFTAEYTKLIVVVQIC